jgi:hypothetical protein
LDPSIYKAFAFYEPKADGSIVLNISQKIENSMKVDFTKKRGCCGWGAVKKQEEEELHKVFKRKIDYTQITPDLDVGVLIADFKLSQISISLISVEELLHLSFNNIRLQAYKYESHVDVNFEIKHL